MGLPAGGAPRQALDFGHLRRQLETPDDGESRLRQALDLAAVVELGVEVSQLEGGQRAIESEPPLGPRASPWLISRCAYRLASRPVSASASATLEGSSRSRNTGVTSARSSWAGFAS